MLIYFDWDTKLMDLVSGTGHCLGAVSLLVLTLM